MYLQTAPSIWEDIVQIRKSQNPPSMKLTLAWPNILGAAKRTNCIALKLPMLNAFLLTSEPQFRETADELERAGTHPASTPWVDTK